MWLTYYLLIGLGVTFIVEVSSKHYAEEIRILNNDDEVFDSFRMIERIALILLWPIIILIIIKNLIKKDDEY